MLNSLELSRLIGLVYETAAEPALWPEVLALSARLLDMVPAGAGDRAGHADGVPADPAPMLARCLLPHLERAFIWRQERDDAALRVDALESVLDRLPLAMALVDAEGRVTSLNQAMLSLSRGSRWLALQQGLLVSRPTSALRDALALLPSQGGTRSAEQALTLGEPGDDDAVSLWLASAPGPSGLTIVLAANRRNARALSSTALASLFGLSQAEARLAQQLALGQPLDEACAALAISGNTGKTHLKRIFAKMGVRRQSELVQAIYASPLWLAPLEGTGGSAPAARRLPEHVPNAEAGRLRLANEDGGRLRLPDANDGRLRLADAEDGRLRLADGRWLSWADVGARDGLPLVLMHGLGGARWTRHPDDGLLLAAGIRLIVPERPGCGDSDPQPGRRLADWPADIAALADHLGLARFAVLGFSAGTPYALAVALAMPQRVAALGLAAAVHPIDRLADLRHYAGNARLPLWMACHASALLPAVLRGVVQQVRTDIHRYVELSMAAATDADREAFADPRLRAAHARGLLANVRRGADDMAADLRVAFSAWELDLSRLAVPVRLWHGDGDKVSTVDGARQLAGRLPGASLDLLSGGGHFLVYSHWPLLIDGMRRLAEGPAAAMPASSRAAA